MFSPIEIPPDYEHLKRKDDWEPLHVGPPPSKMPRLQDTPEIVTIGNENGSKPVLPSNPLPCNNPGNLNLDLNGSVRSMPDKLSALCKHLSLPQPSYEIANELHVGDNVTVESKVTIGDKTYVAESIGKSYRPTHQVTKLANCGAAYEAILDLTKDKPGMVIPRKIPMKTSFAGEKEPKNDPNAGKTWEDVPNETFEGKQIKVKSDLKSKCGELERFCTTFNRYLPLYQIAVKNQHLVRNEVPDAVGEVYVDMKVNGKDYHGSATFRVIPEKSQAIGNYQLTFPK